MESVIGVIMDVTELKQRELVLKAQAKEKKQLLANEAAAKEASRLKSQFLANVSLEHGSPALTMASSCFFLRRCLTRFERPSRA